MNKDMLCVLYKYTWRIFSYCIVIKKPTSIGGETQALEVSNTAFWAFSSVTAMVVTLARTPARDASIYPCTAIP